MYREKIEAYIEQHKDEMIADIMKLVSIDSVRREPKAGMPYGEGAAKVLACARSMMEQYGFRVKNYENQVVTGDFNQKEKQLDILAHLDVVPVSEEWTVVQPFSPAVVDGRIYGRGTSDDKGPAVAALYAMRAVKELGIELDYNVRLILGSDEECGSQDLEYYYRQEEEAPMTFTPDADYPVINIEKGQFTSLFKADFKECEKLPRVFSIKAGERGNVVPGKALGVLEGLTMECCIKAAEEVSKETKVEMQLREEGGQIVVEARGLSGHASTPELANSALTALVAMVVKLPLAEAEGHERLRSIHRLFPHNDYNGSAIGVDVKDALSGELTMNFGIFSYTTKHMEGAFDSRVPLCGTEETVFEVARRRFQEEGFALEDTFVLPPHHVPADSVLVKTLLECYQEHFGKKGQAIAIGGGTYVHELKNGVAFGCAVPEVDNHMHGDDEFVEIDSMVKSAKLFAEVIIKLCTKGNR